MSLPHSRWEHFSHPLGTGVRGFGRDLHESFDMAAHALMALVLVDPKAIQNKQSIQIRCESMDLDLLFSDWLNTLIYEMSQRKMVFGRFEIQVSGINITGVAWGEFFDPSRHQIKGPIQGAGFTELQVEELPGEVRVQCVLNDPRHTLKL